MYKRCYSKKQIPYLINLINCPGNVEYLEDIKATLHISVGVVLLIDYTQGFSSVNEILLYQALLHINKPILMINKLDKALFEIKQEPETIYQSINKIIQDFNSAVSTNQKCEALGDCSINPISGNFVIGSGLGGWGFRLETISEIYSQKFTTDCQKIIEKIWGDNFYDPQENEWTSETKVKDERKLQRGFCMFILDPLIELAEKILERIKEAYDPILKTLDSKPEKIAWKKPKTNKDKLNYVLSKLFNL